jgi:hypothetical protein
MVPITERDEANVLVTGMGVSVYCPHRSVPPFLEY